MDEVSSHVRLDLPSPDGKPAPKIVPPRLRIPYWKGLGADSEEKHEPASDIDTVVVDSLKALDPKRPIREADIANPFLNVCSRGLSGPKPALAIIRFSRLNSAMRYVMEKIPGRDLWAVIDSVTHGPALVNDVPQIYLDLDDADDLTDLLNRLDREASVIAKH